MYMGTGQVQVIYLVQEVQEDVEIVHLLLHGQLEGVSQQ